MPKSGQFLILNFYKSKLTLKINSYEADSAIFINGSVPLSKAFDAPFNFEIQAFIAIVPPWPPQYSAAAMLEISW